MGSINDNIRSKKLYKSGEVTTAYKNEAGELVVPANIAKELDAIEGVDEAVNDAGIFHITKHFIKQIEDMRLDLEELHGFVKTAFGKDASLAASQGPTGIQGIQGVQGIQGHTGEPTFKELITKELVEKGQVVEHTGKGTSLLIPTMEFLQPLENFDFRWDGKAGLFITHKKSRVEWVIEARMPR